MNKNIKIAKELVRIAKSLIATDDNIEQQLKDLNTECFNGFVKKLKKSTGTTVTGSYIAENEINGKKVEVHMYTYSKDNKAGFKYYASINNKNFEQIAEADNISISFKGDSTYDFICNSDDDAKKFLDEYLKSVTNIIGNAKGIDTAFEKAIEELKK